MCLRIPLPSAEIAGNGKEQTENGFIFIMKLQGNNYRSLNIRRRKTMIGRQVIVINRPLSKEELLQFMDEHWDKEQYNAYVYGKPTPASIDEYIVLPATDRFLTIVYPVKKGGLFHRNNAVVLCTADSPAGAAEGLLRNIPSRRILYGAAKMGSLMSSEQERKGPAEETLQAYTAYMRSLLEQAGLTE